MISVDLARRLRDSGLRWRPAAGDRFVIDKPELDDHVFVLSDMTVEVHDFPTGPVIGFNGTTEWALDSVAQEDTLWLPGEDQLRDRLAGTFRRLDRVGPCDLDGSDREGGSDREAPGATVYRVTTVVNGTESTHQHPDVAEAYGVALLGLMSFALESS